MKPSYLEYFLNGITSHLLSTFTACAVLFGCTKTKEKVNPDEEHSLNTIVPTKTISRQEKETWMEAFVATVLTVRKCIEQFLDKRPWCFGKRNQRYLP
jgi:hypothetical protein